MTQESDGLVIRKDVKTKISEERRHELGAEIASHTLRYRDLELEKKELTSGLSSKMKAERKAWEAKADALRTGVLEEQVECVEIADFARNEVSFKRIDTGEIVAVRAMNGEERQLKIDGVDDPAPPVVAIDRGKAKKRMRPEGDSTPENEPH